MDSTEDTKVRNGRVLSDRTERGLHIMNPIALHGLRILTAFRQSYSLVPAMFDVLNLHSAVVSVSVSKFRRRKG